jgi:DNA invertase Pin-like site-specific DNA recombinase
MLKSGGATMTTIGYARVSTDGQTLDAQQSALQGAGCERVFAEKQSGAKTDRAQLAKAIAALGQGDTLIVTKLDRLARSTRDLLNILDAIGKAGATFKSLGDSWANTDTPHGRLMLTVLGGLAEFERHLILARTGEGRRRAQQRGVKFGRKLKLTVHQQQEALARRRVAKLWLTSREATTSATRRYRGSPKHVGQTGVCQQTVWPLHHTGQSGPRPILATASLPLSLVRLNTITNYFHAH